MLEAYGAISGGRAGGAGFVRGAGRYLGAHGLDGGGLLDVEQSLQVHPGGLAQVSHRSQIHIRHDDGMDPGLGLRVRFPVDDAALTTLHARAFGNDPGPRQAWAARLARHSITWVGAFEDRTLVGFVHAVGDGGGHAFLLDTVVDPSYQRRGLGRDLVGALATEVTAAGCDWLHVDYEPHLASFYAACGFRPTAAGLRRLTP